jgi:alpha-aminoadipate carrier protein LysW
MIIVFCIECGGPIRLDSRPRVGDVVVCTKCGVELEIVGVEPVELDLHALEKVDEGKR